MRSSVDEGKRSPRSRHVASQYMRALLLRLRAIVQSVTMLRCKNATEYHQTDGARDIKNGHTSTLDAWPFSFKDISAQTRLSSSGAAS